MKYKRHSKILEIIQKHEVETQQEIGQQLKQIGFEATQATISRDIKELRLIKIMVGSGRYKYAPFTRDDENGMYNKLISIFNQAFVSCNNANNLIILKTLPNMAQAAASAIDALKAPEILGSIAGNDTVMVICKNENCASKLVSRINKSKL